MNKENSIVIDLNKIFKILFTKKVAILKSPFLNILILVSIYFFYPSSYQSSFVLMPTSGKNVSSYEQVQQQISYIFNEVLIDMTFFK